MGCFNGNVDSDTKHLRFLLGSVRFANESETKIYTQAALFKPTIVTKTGSKETKEVIEINEKNACAGQEMDNQNLPPEPTNCSPESNGTLFIPLECTANSLRVQQSFNMWKAPLDIGWKFHKMKKRKTIALQPLDSFPEFVHKFCYKGEEISFFTFLRDFTKIYFYGFNVDILDPVDMVEAKWNIANR